MSILLQLPREMRSVEVRAGSFDETANTIDIVWTTGAAVRRYDYRSSTSYDEVLDLSPGAVRLERLNAGAPFLNTHGSYDLSQVLGSVVPGSAKIEGGRGLATILLSRAAGDADIVQKIRDGVIRNVSAGYIRHQIEKTESDDGAVAIWRVTDWEPCEISAVPIPADPGAQTRSAPAAELFPCVVTMPGRRAIADVARARLRMQARRLGLHA
ncbi:HK97 family phage prohead protease [uncultured Methylobacterium sp.]|uniref:HK97 family phage prohead protease n=1 Tax=uncultured Methylobacterium sp. TaxID=157278 RepID=UPI0035CB9331